MTEAVLRTLSYAFCALDGDNALVAVKDTWARVRRGVVWLAVSRNAGSW